MINPATIRRNKRAILNTSKENTLDRYMDRTAWQTMHNYQRFLVTARKLRCPGAGALIKTRNNQTIIVCTAPELRGGWMLYTVDGVFLRFVWTKRAKNQLRRGWKLMGHILVDFGWCYTPCIPQSLTSRLPINV